MMNPLPIGVNLSITITAIKLLAVLAVIFRWFLIAEMTEQPMFVGYSIDVETERGRGGGLSTQPLQSPPRLKALHRRYDANREVKKFQ